MQVMWGAQKNSALPSVKVEKASGNKVYVKSMLPVENRVLSKDTKWYTTNWGCGKVIEKDGKIFFWYWEHPMKTNCIARRPVLTLENTSKKTTLLIDDGVPK